MEKGLFKKSVLYASSEVQPFCATGGLADVVGSLPVYLKNENPDCDVRVIMPLYKNMKIDRNKLTYLGNTFVSLSWRSEYCGIFYYKLNGITYYFIDNEKYFKRDGYYGYMDDGERFAFFSRAILTVLPIIDFFPDIIHVNDWQTALVPVYLKVYQYDERYSHIKTVLSIHNIIYQGRYGKQILTDVLGIDSKYYSLLTHDGDVNFIKASVLCADKVVTVSNAYSSEIQTLEGGQGLDDIMRQASYKLVGIVNGLDYDFYNPSKDDIIWANYSKEDLTNKAVNKAELQKEFGLEINPDKPIISIVTRMVKNKGLDMLKCTLEHIFATTDAQFVAVGEGEREYEDFFKYLNAKYPSRAHTSLGFSTDIGRKIYAGSDIFLMPSISEPCGLAQMIASRYGTIPVVREVGGLKDTIKDFGCPDGGNGYTFHDVSNHDFEYSVVRAINDYKNKEEWKKKMIIVMNKNFSWEHQSHKYIRLYEEM